MSTLVSVAPLVSQYARHQRWAEFYKRFPEIEDMTVLDLGGTAEFWLHAPRMPGSLTLLNYEDQDMSWANTKTSWGSGPCKGRPLAASIVGDACKPNRDKMWSHYDLIFSNSVIGHVGGHWRRRMFSHVVHHYGTYHWIQTPYRYFPIDAFMGFPGFMSLPVAARVQVSLCWPIGTRRTDDYEDAVTQVLGVEFLTRTEMRHYFPGSELWTERLLGLPKSIVAVYS